jgi:hypothetical protein
MMSKDMDMRITPGLELTNNMCQPKYPQKFVNSVNTYEGEPRFDRVRRDQPLCKEAMKISRGE